MTVSYGNTFGITYNHDDVSVVHTVTHWCTD